MNKRLIAEVGYLWIRRRSHPMLSNLCMRRFVPGWKVLGYARSFCNEGKIPQSGPSVVKDGQKGFMSDFEPDRAENNAAGFALLAFLVCCHLRTVPSLWPQRARPGGH